MRRHSPICTALLLISLVSSSCPASAAQPSTPSRASPILQAQCPLTHIHTSVFKPEFQGIPWIAATPRSAHVRGILFFRRLQPDGTYTELHTGGHMPDGGATKILWLIDNPRAGRSLTVRGRNLTGSGRTRQSFPQAGNPGQVPSILDVPTSGCWTFTLKSGRVKAMVTMRVVDGT